VKGGVEKQKQSSSFGAMLWLPFYFPNEWGFSHAPREQQQRKAVCVCLFASEGRIASTIEENKNRRAKRRVAPLSAAGLATKTPMSQSSFFVVALCGKA
jgi:hypothetical protein